jgi:ABC-type nitrate/sulfonate/bicarbonate transport system substrate-binding protein
MIMNSILRWAIIQRISAGLFLLALITVGGCTNKATSQSSDGASIAGNKKHVTIRLPDTLSDLAFVAEEKGFFEKEGIKIQWTGKQAHGPANIVSIAAGQNDAGSSISTAMIQARKAGNNVRIVLPSSISTAQKPLVTYLVLENGPYKKPEDLLGQKVVASPQTITWYPLIEYLKKKGLDPKTVEFVTLRDAGQQEQALRQGDVAAIAVVEPVASLIKKRGGIKLILSDFDALEINQIGGWAFSDDFIKNNPDAVMRFVRAILAAVDFIKTDEANLKEAEKIIEKRTGIAARVPELLPARQFIVSERDITRWIDIVERNGSIKPGEVKPIDVFTNEFNPYANK